ncbi:uncharacterized protein LOC113798633 [Dermatophagoides pteronyssinus]|uniref:uncharacterized protein LOC113798633 n=1 Tax=Dermatophagoides pteronyssinus TaxID=6956 RepID=UPI003F6782DE
MLNLKQKSFTIGFMEDQPFIATNDRNERKGIEVEMMETFAKKFNFTINYQNFRQSSWSNLYDNLTNGDIDFGMGGTVITAERFEKVSYLYPHIFDKFTFATSPSIANLNHFDLNILIRPMDSSVWLLLALTLIIILFVGRLFQYIQPSIQFNNHHKNIRHDLFDICIHHLFRQSVPLLRLTNRPTKICSMFWTFTAVIVLANNYTGSLSSMLALPSHYSMDSVKELAKQLYNNPNLRTIGIANSTPFQSMKLSTIEEIQLIGQRMDYIKDDDLAINVIIDQSKQRRSLSSNGPSYVFMASRLRLIFEMISFGKNLVYVPLHSEAANLYPLYVAIAVTKSFAHRRQFDQIIFYLHSSGILNHWIRMEAFRTIASRNSTINHQRDNNDIDQQQQQEDKSKTSIFNSYVAMNNLEFDDLKSIFILYIISISITLVTFLFEFISLLSFCHCKQMINDQPFISTNGRHDRRGIEVEMMETLAKKFNFTINYQSFRQSTWSYLYDNLTNEEIDFVIGGTVMTTERLEKVHYLYPHIFDKFTFATSPSIANLNHFDLNILIRPMDSSVWLLVAITLIIILFVGRLFQSVQPSIQLNNHHPNIRHDLFDICIHHLFRQSVPLLRLANRPTKICSMFWTFTAVIVLANNYTGSLCSMLALPSQYTMDTVKELAKQFYNNPNLRTIGIANSTPYQSMKLSTIEEIQLIGQRMDYINDNDLAINVIIDQSKQRRSLSSNGLSYVFISSRLRLIFEMFYAGKEVIFVPPHTEAARLYSLCVAIAVTKPFAYRKQFDRMIFYFHSYGMFRHWLKKESIRTIASRIFQMNHDDETNNSDNIDQHQHEKQSKTNIFNPYVSMNNLKFNDLKSIFFLYIISISITLISFLMEFISSLSSCKRMIVTLNNYYSRILMKCK